MVFNQTISEFTECHVTAFHPMNIFKLNHYVIKSYIVLSTSFLKVGSPHNDYNTDYKQAVYRVAVLYQH